MFMYETLNSAVVKLINAESNINTIKLYKKFLYECSDLDYYTKDVDNSIHYLQFEFASNSLILTKILLDLGANPTQTYEDHPPIYWAIQGKLRQLYDCNSNLDDLCDTYTNKSDVHETLSWYELHENTKNKYKEMSRETQWRQCWPRTPDVMMNMFQSKRVYRLSDYKTPPRKLVLE